VRDEAALYQIDMLAQQIMLRHNTPGISIALTDRKGQIGVATEGFADVAAGTRVKPEHLFEFGSIGKSFTAVALLQLREEGRLDLHMPVTEYLPWFSVRSTYAPITIHHLLSHTSGLSGGTDFTPDPRLELWSARELHVAHAPGEHYHYSNLGYKLLGLLLERLEGRPYAEVIQRRILDPLEMRATLPVITHAVRQRMATGHTRLFDDRPSLASHPVVPATWFETNTGDGCICATASDLSIWLRMLLNRGATAHGRLISEESFDLLTQRVIAPTPDQDVWYGYGIRTRVADGYTEIGHSGGMVGYLTGMLGSLEDGVGAVVMVNGSGEPMTIAREAVRLLVAATRGGTLPDLPVEPDSFAVGNASEYAGTYASATLSLSVVAEGDRLHIEHDGQSIPLRAWSTDAFLADHPDFDRFLLTFGREDGRVVERLHGADWYIRSTYTGPLTFDYPPEWDAFPGHYRSHNPWVGSFRVVLRKGQLWLIFPEPVDGFGTGQMLRPLDDGSFGVDVDGYCYDRLRFDAVVDGQALRASLSGADYARFFTP
jgi:CubicO group peptidase (beta-lactamase class C family)